MIATATTPRDHPPGPSAASPAPGRPREREIGVPDLLALIAGWPGLPRSTLLVLPRSQAPGVADVTYPRLGSYDMDAAFMSLELHERGIHVV